MNSAGTVWPTLSYPTWRDTAVTLQLWTQIVGKFRLALTPWVNHGWHVTLYVTARGLGTSPIPIKNEIFEIEFDFIVTASSSAPAGARSGCSRSNRKRLPTFITGFSIS
jgi:hypothetical protein